MLANMDTTGGADSLGKGMAVALVTTFYGSVLVNMVCAPVSNRLKAMHEEEMIAKDLIMEGVLSIQSGENPKYIREKLSSYIAHTEREAVGEAKEEAKESKRGFAGRRKNQEKNA
jgi:chemotaxis protein MotA